jgi:hypothetical protein
MKNTFAALFMLGLILENTANAAVLKILSSEPETKVYEVTDPMKKKSLGTAPLALEDFDTSEPRLLMLEKHGFASVYIPFSQGVATHFAIQANMHPISDWTSDELTRKTVDMAESLVDRITAVQSLLDARKTKEALAQVETLKNEYPTSFSVRLIHANALLLNGEGQKAQVIYKTLLSEVPANRTALKDAIDNIQKRLGSRMPASVGGNQ